MKFLVIDNRYIHNYGYVKGLKFSRSFDDLEDALKYIHNQNNWYDLSIVTVIE